MKKLLNNLLDFIWPQFCLGCNREGSLCCGFCLNDILLDDLKTISWPDKNKLYFEACYNCCNYQDKLVQKIIKNYKYNYLENLAELLIDILEKQARRLNLDKNTIVVNAPLHKNKKRQRGFDQTEILAKQLAKRLSLDYSPLLIRTKNNPAQAKLDKTARQKNVADIFAINKKVVPNKRPNILLIDDVVTTGSTLNQASKVLKKLNYTKIVCLTIAKN
ncbi:MAG: ComF family protein [Candidatus Komeilibacteria bacterium]|jgi:ComF family protein|nr:ComF family protein [Candidatus Komeilibacteria bacterium]